MRILHIVPLHSPDGSYGGPMRVALNDVAELQARGHSVELVAGWRGSKVHPTSVGGVEVRLFRAWQFLPFGYSGLFSPGMLIWLLKKAAHFDVAHVHAGRDLIGSMSTVVMFLRGLPFVLQTHGMVGPDARVVARLFDGIFFRKVIARAKRVLFLTERERAELATLFPEAALQALGNGVMAPQQYLRSAPDILEVLFCARMHKRKRPLEFVHMASLVLARHPNVRFSMIGPDEGEVDGTLKLIESLGLSKSVRYEGALPYQEVEERMSFAAIYVLPSIDEPYPMSLLEALALGLPCVTTTSCGLSNALVELDAALVTGPEARDLAAAVSRLIADAQERNALGARARVVAESHFSIGAIVDQLVSLYLECARVDYATGA